MSLIEILLLGILIMQMFIFHSNASGSGRYMKLFDFIVHRPTQYTERKTVVLSKKALSKGSAFISKSRNR